MLGLAARAMIAASHWSLLARAIEMSAGKSIPTWVPAAVGFVLGGTCPWGIDKLLPHPHPGFTPDQTEGLTTTSRRTTLLILAVTLHNISEGLAIGVGLGAAAAGIPAASLTGAVA